jgi:hypothetical protein
LTGRFFIIDGPVFFISDNERDVIMNNIAATVVIRDNIVAAPRAPNAAIDPPPPKTSAMLPAFPAWSNTTPIKKTPTITCSTINKVSTEISPQVLKSRGFSS